MKKILIIEDDPAILIGLQASLEEDNYELITATDGDKGFQLAKTANPNVIILDIMLPSKNGLDVCRDLRKLNINTPVLMLTAKKEEIDKVLGFETGADDYLTKPFSIMELKMRIKALLRRTEPGKKEIESFECGNLKINFKRLEAFKNNEQLNLSAKEFQILKYFTEREGEIISRDMLLDDVWGYESYPTTRTVDNFILTLRKKIEDDPSQPKHILTVHTVGYKFVKG
ncbi:MAG: response regulator transcription factor [Bacteroidetes bacterium]|nr:MAG: response regulator transcription factor [Bacteroidota bacterium]